MELFEAEKTGRLYAGNIGAERREVVRKFDTKIDASAAMRTGTADETAEAGAFLRGEHAEFISGTDLLIDGGVIAAIRTGTYSLHE